MKTNCFEKQQNALDEVNEYIITYLDTSLRMSVLVHHTPSSRLAYLKQCFGRSYVHEEQVRMKWKVFSAQKPNGDVEKWLFDWNDLREQAINLPAGLCHLKASKIKCW
ncbi:hypothetical protein N7516_005234 [Penicillium verrucosum]|uniref:uncharacterized protein n=1 Tax=Penicillium verrucosum TaxID=60171 RepID=UPI002545485A|nr:uncharacterized protein N7516_005234 [Penicillium verrucosum]KAJ5945066.1 hypothetical protein N7516_005234 [Penicillium verrucosum]